MDYVLNCTGGIGFHICFTSFIKWLNEKEPKSKLTIISAFPDLFEHNPRIYRNLHHSQPYLFEDYMKDKDYRMGFPYQLFEYYKEEGKRHLMELFPKAYLFNELNLSPTSEIYLSDGEEIDGKVFAKQNFPLITFQGFGGLPPGAIPSKEKVDSSQRDMKFEFATKLVSLLIKHDLKVLQIRTQSEPILPGTIQLNLPFRNLLPISKYSLGNIGIDSSMMHGASLFSKPQLIFWGHTHIDNLGYKYTGMFNKSNKYGMSCRPHIQLPDREGVFPFRDPFEHLIFNYSDKELETYVNEFVAYIKKGE